MYDIYYIIGGVLLVLLVNSLIVMPIVVFFLGRSVSKLKKQVNAFMNVKSRPQVQSSNYAINATDNQYKTATKTKDLITGLSSQLINEKPIEALIQTNPTYLVKSVEPALTNPLKPVEKGIEPNYITSYPKLDPNTRTETKEVEVKNDFGFIDWIKTNFLLKFGVILVILAISGLVTYAFGNNWIGPMGRLFWVS